MVDIKNLPLPTAAEAARFLGHASLGYTMAEVTELQNIGYDAWFTKQFDIAEDAYPGHFDWLQAVWPPIKGVFGQNYLEYSVWRRFIDGNDVLRQKITLILSEILVVSIKNGLGGHWPEFLGAYYLDILQSHAFGNYRELLEEISTCPAQGHYLTFVGSEKANDQGRRPDENYARELLQLFTIGLQQLRSDGEVDSTAEHPETYTNAEITELAKIFTNWVVDGYMWDEESLTQVSRPLKNDADPNKYDNTAVDLGRIDKAGLNAGPIQPSDAANAPQVRLNEALNRIYAHPSLAPFLSKQLIKHMVTSNPSPDYVRRVARAFDPQPLVSVKDGNGNDTVDPNWQTKLASKGNMKEVVKAILMDDSLFDASLHRVGGLGDPSFGKLREPACRFVHFARAFGMASASGKWTGIYLQDMQTPMYAPSVFNFYRPGYVPPNSKVAEHGMVAPEFQMATEPTVVSYVNTITNVLHYGVNNDIKANFMAWTSKASKPASLVADLNLLFTANALQPVTVKRITQAISSMPMGTTDLNTKRVKAAILLVMASPEYLIQK